MRLIDSLSVRLWSIVLASQHKTIIPPHFLRSISNMDDISKYYGLQWEGLSRRCEPGKGSAAAACIVEQMESGPSDHCATPRLPSLPRQIRYAYYCFPNILQGAGGKNLFTHIQCWIFKFMPCTKYLLSLWFDDNKFGSDQLSDFEPSWSASWNAERGEKIIRSHRNLMIAYSEAANSLWIFLCLWKFKMDLDLICPYNCIPFVIVVFLIRGRPLISMQYNLYSWSSFLCGGNRGMEELPTLEVDDSTEGRLDGGKPRRSKGFRFQRNLEKYTLEARGLKNRRKGRKQAWVSRPIHPPTRTAPPAFLPFCLPEEEECTINFIALHIHCEQSSP